MEGRKSKETAQNKGKMEAVESTKVEIQIYKVE